MKINRLIFCICFAALLLSSCAPATPAPSTKAPVKQEEAPSAASTPQLKRIGVLMQNVANKRYTSIDIPNMQKVADEAGYELLIQAAEYDAKVQVSQAESLLTQGVDVLILQPVDTTSASAVVDMATRQNVPVVGYNDLALDVPLKAFVGRDPYEAGVVTAKAGLKAHPTGKYVLIGGVVTVTVAKEYVRGWHEVLAPEVEAGNIIIVSDQFQSAWDANLARAQTENALTQNNDDIQVILGNNDDMARGAAEAVKAAGLPLGPGPDEIYINGMDCSDDILQMIAEGTMGGSIWGTFDQMGRDVIRTAIAVVEGKTFDYSKTVDNGWGEIPWVEAPVVLITKDNLADFVCETQSYWVPIDVAYKNIPRDQWPSCGD